ncbi:LytR/AlgR family response regulator transcription factor [Zhouia sp. PK063]|uniref:LytR/AlgR family response regulator transcription factor n=1 Tax=Zhouia sp. PK063 TaxID=3373602 RepID=UPI0037B4559B
MFNTIIIDDELPARLHLKKLLSHFSKDIKVIAEAQSGSEARDLINTLQPDLVFLDIEMPGLTGFQLLEKLQHMPLIVFCTAYDQYSLQAFETNSVDYLVKPVRLERLQKTIEKTKRFNPSTNNTHKILDLVRELTEKKEEKEMVSLAVKKDDKLIFIKLEDITYFEADERYVLVHSPKGKFLTEQSLAKLELRLPNYFLRIHRSIIINTKYVEEIQKYFNSRYTIKLNNKGVVQITSGRSYLQAIKNWIEM